MELYLHEFTHTVQLYLEVYDFHDALVQYSSEHGNIEREIDVIRLYLLNQLIINGEHVGIPFYFWEEKLDRGHSLE